MQDGLAEAIVYNMYDPNSGDLFTDKEVEEAISIGRKTMAKYIDRDALLEHLKKDPLFDCVERYGISGVIESFPAADVVERKTGKWINYLEDGFVECPFCGAATNCDGEISELHYCFNCGAELEENVG